MYARSVLMIEKPRVGLLSIGEEESKGNELTREALQVLKQLPIRFIGNVEGRDLYNGHADVIVCDGFVGNVALKTSEGLGRMVREMLRESLMSTVSGRGGALLARRGFKEFKKRFDQSEYGGAPLLGVRGPCIITHGSADDRAILNSIRVAAEFATSGRDGPDRARVQRACCFVTLSSSSLLPYRRLSVPKAAGMLGLIPIHG